MSAHDEWTSEVHAHSALQCYWDDGNNGKHNYSTHKLISTRRKFISPTSSSMEVFSCWMWNISRGVCGDFWLDDTHWKLLVRKIGTHRGISFQTRERMNLCAFHTHSAGIIPMEKDWNRQLWHEFWVKLMHSAQLHCVLDSMARNILNVKLLNTLKTSCLSLKNGWLEWNPKP